MRVLMVAARYLPDLGGIETHVDEVARRIAARPGTEVTVLATDRSRLRAREEERDGIRVLRVPAWPARRDYYLAPGIASVVGRRGEWDLVHCQGVHTPVPVLAMAAARRAHLPYMVTFHTGGHSLAHRNTMRAAQWRLLGPLLRRADVLIGVSRFEADLLSEQAHLPEGLVQVIRNGGSLPAPQPGTTPVSGRIVSSGRLERYKGHHRAIEALPEIMAHRPEAHLVILGTGPYQADLEALAARLQVADRVTIRHLPPQDRVAMATELARAEVVAALSDYEAHPVAVMEALSLGLPVVGVDVAGIGDLVAQQWVYPVAGGAISGEVAWALQHAMSSGPRVDPAVLPTWDSCAEELAAFYERVIAETGRGGVQ